MRHKLLALLFGLFAAITPVAAGAAPAETKTLFEYAASSWAVGTLRLGQPMPFRQGKVLAYPGQITDLLWAPVGEPHNAMIVVDVASGDDPDKPFLAEGDVVFGPIKLLPDHSYYRDNLPNTPKHQINGGRRYVFRGDEIPAVRELLGAYLEAAKINGLQRWTKQLDVVVRALGGPIVRVREDAARFLVGYEMLGRDLGAESLPGLQAYLTGQAPAEERASVVTALAAGKVEKARPVLEKVAELDDAAGAAALAALEQLGAAPSDASLDAWSKSASVERRAYAAGAYGRRAAADSHALERAKAILGDAEEADSVRAAAAEGLGAAGGDGATAALLATVERGDAASRAAGLGLASIGTPGVVAGLSKILREQRGEAAAGAVYGLGRIPACAECGKVLVEQHKAHPDEGIRQLISVIMEMPLEHKH